MMIPILAQHGSHWLLPDQASSYAKDIDFLIMFIWWVSTAVFVGILVAATYFIWKHRGKPGENPTPSKSHSTALELTWTLIPTVIFLVIFYWGFRGYVDMSTPPDDAYEVQARAFKWGWEFQYPEGGTSKYLVIPKDRPVRVTLMSDDVIHSLFIPAFRAKKDAVPGRFNKMWFQATALPPERESAHVDDVEGAKADAELGLSYFDLYCTEYCGTSHSEMRSRVYVLDDPEAFRAFTVKAANPYTTEMSPVTVGEMAYSRKSCNTCHSVDGEPHTGPTWKNLFGYQIELADGTQVLADENYIRTAILNPGSQIHKGYNNVMPSYQGRIKEIEIRGLIEYMKSISDKAPAPLEAFPTEPEQPQASATTNSVETPMKADDRG